MVVKMFVDYRAWVLVYLDKVDKGFCLSKHDVSNVSMHRCEIKDGAQRFNIDIFTERGRFFFYRILFQGKYCFMDTGDVGQLNCARDIDLRGSMIVFLDPVD